MPADGMQQYFEKSLPKREAPTKGISNKGQINNTYMQVQH
jgi:hypothetical protein